MIANYSTSYSLNFLILYFQKYQIKFYCFKIGKYPMKQNHNLFIFEDKKI